MLFSLAIIVSKAQEVNLFADAKPQNQGYILYASNNEICPVSISIGLDLSNLLFSEGQKTVFVIPAKAEKFRIGDLDIVKTGTQIKYSFKYKAVLGDATIKLYDINYAYDLPFEKGRGCKVDQGYNGSFSHQHENAIDFNMPEGTPIVAAREGLVVKVVQQNTESCPRQECIKYANYVRIYHADGTFAEYAHIKYNGSSVKVGDTVKKGDVIAFSGKTGWTTGPHLHFICFLPDFATRNSLETKFRVNDGKRIGFLIEQDTYVKLY
ncbi:M23 family metallopeptidase [Parasediminibacterium sp. JCM 36343]|uniref:M23 family metallopeptidase n=1 Tax=Parasediminibacterium sp. JCM 36343 TaxID=3374279 RepID=UPI003977F0CD